MNRDLPAQDPTENRHPERRLPRSTLLPALRASLRGLLVLGIATLSFLGGIDPPYARASQTEAAPLRFDIQKAQALADQRNPERNDPALALERALGEIHVDRPTGKAASRDGADLDAIARRVVDLQSAVEAQLAEVRGQFEADRQWFIDQGLESLLPRVDEAEALASERHAQVMDALRAVAQSRAKSADLEAPLSELKSLLASWQPASQGPMSAEAMREEMRMPVAGAPFKSSEEFLAFIADGGKTVEGLVQAKAPPTAADLLETPEVVFSEAVQAKVVELDGNPLAIYLWVRNHIKVVPGYGAAQSADFTLLNGQGTPFDIASLTIAMLRSAGIPARYATGRVSMSAAQVRSWMEPVAGAADAVEVLQNAGVPAAARVVNGVVEEAQLEHVWVEAYVDYEPSRGTVHRQGDTWVPMDPSFKAHQVTARSRLPNVAPLLSDLEQVLNARTAHPGNGFSVLDIDRLGEAVDRHSARFEPTPGSSGDERPRIEIVPDQSSTFAGSLPYLLMSRAGGFSSLPDGLRYRVAIEALRGGTNQLFPVGFSAVYQRAIPLAEIGSGGIDIEYAPADEASETALNQWRREAAEAIAPYGVSVRPALIVNGRVMDVLPSVRMGSAEQWRFTVLDPLRLRPGSARPFSWNAGASAHIGINPFGIAPAVLAKEVPEQLLGTKVGIHQFLKAAGLGFFATQDFYRDVLSGVFEGRLMRVPSVGAFYQDLTVTYFFGVPRRGFANSFTTDVYTTYGISAKSAGDSRAMLTTIGSIGSLLEGLIWDLQTAGALGRGISTTSVMLAANEQGIPIYEIDDANFDEVFPQLQLNQESLQEIAAAVGAGMVVTTPLTEVSVDGQPTVAGYYIRDPRSGAGLSRIDASTNGGKLFKCLGVAISLDELLARLILYYLEKLIAPLVQRGIARAAFFANGLLPVTLAYAGTYIWALATYLAMQELAIEIASTSLVTALCYLLGLTARGCRGNGAAGGGGSDGRGGKSRGRGTFGRPIMPEIQRKTLYELDYAGEGPFPLYFERYYLSDSLSRAGMARGWNGSYFSRLVIQPESNASFIRAETYQAGQRPPRIADPSLTGLPSAVLVHTETGTYYEFKRRGSTFFSDAIVPQSLAFGAGGGFVLTEEDDIREQYSSDGRLLSLTDRNGVRQTLVYDDDGRVVAVQHSLGRRLAFEYDQEGNLSAFIDPAQRRTTYQYESGRLVRATRPDGTSRRYLYEDARFPDRLTGLIDERGVREFTAAYDYRGRAVETTGPDGVDHFRFRYQDDRFTAIDPLGTSRSFTLAKRADASFISGSDQPCSSCGGSDSEVLDLDEGGYPTTVTDFEGNRSRYRYNRRGLLESVSEALGTAQERARSIEWSPVWRVPTRIVEPTTQGNRVTTHSLDPAGNVLERRITVGGETRTWRYTYNASGQLLSEDGPRSDVNDVTRYSYDSQGNLETMTDALGFITRYVRYDALGRLLEMVDPNGLATEYVYDQRDRLVEQRIGPEGSAAREIYRYGYDAAGNPIRMTLPDASYLAYEYDDAGRLVQTSDALGNRVDYSYDALGNRTGESIFDPANILRTTESSAHDALGRLVSIQRARSGELTRFSYDANGNQLSIQSPLHAQPDSSAYDALQRLVSTRDATGAEIGYVYDAQDNLREVVDPRGLRTRYTYSGFDELTRLASPDTGIADFEFDAMGNLLAQTDARGTRAGYRYDAGNRLTQVDYPDERLGFEYDDAATGGSGASGRLVSASSAALNSSALSETFLSFEYDIFGRVIERAQSVDQGGVLSTTHEYDDGGRIARSVLPSGVEIRYGYGSDGRVLRILVNGVEIVRDIEYFPMGEPKSWRYGPGTARYERVFDDDGRVSGHTLGGATREIDYDLNGRIVAIADDAGARSDWRFGYDDADRLTSADNAAGAGPTAGLGLDWLYDATGNRTAQTRAAESLSYAIDPASNRLVSRSGALSDVREYDANGNTLGWLADAGDFAGQRLHSRYGGRNRLQTVDRVDAGGALRIARYAYNAFGERVAKWTGAAASIPGSAPSEQAVYDDGGRLLGRYTGNGQLIGETLWLDDTPVALINPATASQSGQAVPASAAAPAVSVFFIHPDHLDTPRLVLNAAEQPVWRWESAPFGDTEADANPSGLGSFDYTQRFPGQQYDAESGLHYNNFRDYEAAIGRYMQVDPLIEIPAFQTQQPFVDLSRYTYSASGPGQSTDPWGLAKEPRPPWDKDVDRTIFDRQSGKCNSCGGGLGADPHKGQKRKGKWQIHHRFLRWAVGRDLINQACPLPGMRKSLKRRFFNLLFNLEGLCEPCHKKKHSKK